MQHCVIASANSITAINGLQQTLNEWPRHRPRWKITPKTPRQIDLVKPLWKQSASVAIQQKRLNAMNRGSQSGPDKSRAP
jgi:hypothetical protein